MKRIAILTGILLVLVAGAAFAEGVNLAWDNCHGGTAPPPQLDKNIPCADATPPATLMGSFVLGTGADPTATWSSVDNQLDLQVDTPVPTTFWNVGTGPTLGARYSVSPQAGQCPPWWGTEVPATATSFREASNGTRSRLRVILDLANAGPGNLNAGTEYSGFAVTINMGGSTADAVGCNRGVCFVYNGIFLEDPLNTGAEYRVQNAQTRQHATWKGAAIVTPGFCPQATPTLKKTWGAIKAIYR